MGDLTLMLPWGSAPLGVCSPGGLLPWGQVSHLANVTVLL